MYTLVLITILAGGVVDADHKGNYVDMTACFDARDTVLVEHRAWDGLFEPGVQAVCVETPAE